MNHVANLVAPSRRTFGLSVRHGLQRDNCGSQTQSLSLQWSLPSTRGSGGTINPRIWVDSPNGQGHL